MPSAVGGVPSKELNSGPGHLPHGSGNVADLQAPSTASWLLMAAGPAVLFEASQLQIWDGWAMQVSTIFCNSAFLTARTVISTVMLKASQLPLLGCCPAEGEGSNLTRRDTLLYLFYPRQHGVRAATNFSTTSAPTGLMERHSAPWPLPPSLLPSCLPSWFQYAHRKLNQ